jgi:hypothetical protein
VEVTNEQPDSAQVEWYSQWAPGGGFYASNQPPAGVLERNGSYYVEDPNAPGEVLRDAAGNFVRSTWSPTQAWQPGTDLSTFYSNPAFGYTSQFFWQDYIYDRLTNDMKGVAAELGEDPIIWLGITNGLMGSLLAYLDESVVQAYSRGPRDPSGNPFAGVDPETGHSWITGTSEGRDALYMIARNWMIRHDGRLVAGYAALDAAGPRGRGGSGSGISAADFDLDQLANAANNAWRAYLLEECPDPRSIARAYVDAYLANPAQKLDFDTFVLGRIKQAPRFNTIYMNKPEGMDELEFISPYISAAQQLLSPDNVNRSAVAGARMAASPDAYASYLLKQQEVVTSAPFMQKLGERLSGLKQVLR